MTEGTFIFLQANIRFKNLSHSIYPNIDGLPPEYKSHLHYPAHNTCKSKENQILISHNCLLGVQISSI